MLENSPSPTISSETDAQKLEYQKSLQKVILADPEIPQNEKDKAVQELSELRAAETKKSIEAQVQKIQEIIIKRASEDEFAKDLRKFTASLRKLEAEFSDSPKAPDEFQQATNELIALEAKFASQGFVVQYSFIGGALKASPVLLSEQIKLNRQSQEEPETHLRGLEKAANRLYEETQKSKQPVQQPA